MCSEHCSGGTGKIFQPACRVGVSFCVGVIGRRSDLTRLSRPGRVGGRPPAGPRPPFWPIRRGDSIPGRPGRSPPLSHDRPSDPSSGLDPPTAAEVWRCDAKALGMDPMRSPPWSGFDPRSRGVPWLDPWSHTRARAHARTHTHTRLFDPSDGLGPPFDLGRSKDRDSSPGLRRSFPALLLPKGGRVARTLGVCGGGFVIQGRSLHPFVPKGGRVARTLCGGGEGFVIQGGDPWPCMGFKSEARKKRRRGTRAGRQASERAEQDAQRVALQHAALQHVASRCAATRCIRESGARRPARGTATRCSAIRCSATRLHQRRGKRRAAPTRATNKCPKAKQDRKAAEPGLV